MRPSTNQLALHAQRVAASVLHFHCRILAGRANGDDHKSPVARDVDVVVDVDVIVAAWTIPSQKELRGIGILGSHEAQRFVPMVHFADRINISARLAAGQQLHDEEHRGLGMFVKIFVESGQIPVAAHGHRGSITGAALMADIERSIFGRCRKIEMPGRLVAPLADIAAELGIGWSMAGGVFDAGIGLQPQAKIGTVGVGLPSRRSDRRGRVARSRAAVRLQRAARFH